MTDVSLLQVEMELRWRRPQDSAKQPTFLTKKPSAGRLKCLDGEPLRSLDSCPDSWMGEAEAEATARWVARWLGGCVGDVRNDPG